MRTRLIPLEWFTSSSLLSLIRWPLMFSQLIQSMITYLNLVNSYFIPLHVADAGSVACTQGS